MNSEVIKKPRPRPLSPHIQVYSWLITSTLSILHRLSGVANSAGLLLITCWVLILAYNPNKYDAFVDFIGSPLGNIILIGWTFSLYYHLLNGIRHLFWDFGKGFELDNVTISGLLVLISTVTLSALTWAVVWGYIKI